MFDRHSISQHVTVINEAPVRAPTDESVKLLQEMQSKALLALVDNGKMENNEVTIRWHLFLDWPNGGCYTIVCQFKINGKDHKVIEKLPERFRATPRDIFESVRDIILKALQETFLMSFYKSEDFKQAIYSYEHRIS